MILFHLILCLILFYFELSVFHFRNRIPFHFLSLYIPPPLSLPHSLVSLTHSLCLTATNPLWEHPPIDVGVEVNTLHIHLETEKPHTSNVTHKKQKKFLQGSIDLIVLASLSKQRKAYQCRGKFLKSLRFGITTWTFCVWLCCGSQQTQWILTPNTKLRATNTAGSTNQTLKQKRLLAVQHEPDLADTGWNEQIGKGEHDQTAEAAGTLHQPLNQWRTRADASHWTKAIGRPQADKSFSNGKKTGFDFLAVTFFLPVFFSIFIYFFNASTLDGWFASALCHLLEWG